MVYLIQNTETLDVKIGRTNNIVERKKSLQTGSSTELRILYTIDAPDSFEQHMHSVCGRYRKSGEWFDKDVLNHLIRHPWFRSNMMRFR